MAGKTMTDPTIVLQMAKNTEIMFLELDGDGEYLEQEDGDKQPAAVRVMQDNKKIAFLNASENDEAVVKVLWRVATGQLKVQVIGTDSPESQIKMVFSKLAEAVGATGSVIDATVMAMRGWNWLTVHGYRTAGVLRRSSSAVVESSTSGQGSAPRDKEKKKKKHRKYSSSDSEDSESSGETRKRRKKKRRGYHIPPPTYSAPNGSGYGGYGGYAPYQYGHSQGLGYGQQAPRQEGGW